MLDHMCWACNGDAQKLSLWAHEVLWRYKRVEVSEKEGWFLPRALMTCALCSFLYPTMREWKEGLPSLLKSSKKVCEDHSREKQKSHVVWGQRDNHRFCAWEYWGQEGSWSHPPTGRAEGDRSSPGISYTFTYLTNKSVCFSSDSQEQNSLEPFLNSAQENSQKKTVSLVEELWLWMSRGRGRNQKSERDTACIKGTIWKASVGILWGSHTRALS